MSEKDDKLPEPIRRKLSVADPAEHGFVGSVSKPTSLDDLRESIRTALGRSVPG